MKRILSLVLLLATVFFASCKKEVSHTVEVSGLSLDHTTMSILMGQTRTLVASVTPDNATNTDVTWSSSDATVATVTDAGKVTAVKVGTAIITVACKANSNKTATCTVTVTSEVVAVSEIRIDKTTLSIAPGSKKNLVATIIPENATNTDVTWSSSDKTIATVSATGEVTAIKLGAAIITATSVSDKAKTATCAVAVTNEIVEVTGLSLNKVELSLNAGTKETLIATITPENATNTDVTWSSSDETIATVSATGEVTAVKAGAAIITATAMSDKAKTATCAVTVPATATISLDNTSQANIPWQGGTYTVNVTSNGAWSAISTVNPGISITPNSGNVGVTSVVITVPQENTGAPKSALVEFTAALSGTTAIATWTGTQDWAATVTIAGTKWATRNLNAVAQGQTAGFTMATNPQDYGYFWKWGSVYAYDRTGGAIPSDHWGDWFMGAALEPSHPTTGGGLEYGYDYANAGNITPASAGPAGDPCKALGAYRTPTQEQWRALVDAGQSVWVWDAYQGVAGYFFGTKAGDCNDATIAENCIFIPTAGYRSWQDGSLFEDATTGYYWSSSLASASDGFRCELRSFGVGPYDFGSRSLGLSVRCVQE